ncbi:MAG: extracellular solute-binding protein [Lachnospiraceae bacterium]|nr:extracellular solute-binding protein [Lachnospiraceae bacterium]
MRKTRLMTALTAGAMLMSLMTGCGAGTGTGENTADVKLDPSNPVSLTIWHYYNGAQQAAFDELVQEFNATVGKEKGIYVEGYSQGSVVDLETAITDSVEEKVGSQPMPDLFSTYADTAYGVQQQGKLADLNAYFTEEELSEYVESYIQEGHFNDDGALYLFPVAKSTEIMMMNATDWVPFAEATGSTIDELKTLEGITAVAERYYDWTDAQTPDVPDDGKAFYGRDSMANYFIIAMKQMGIDIFDVKDGEVTIQADKTAIRRLWDNYYVPFVKGHFNSLGKFRSDDVKTGDILAYTGSTSSSMYFPDEVVLESGSTPIDYMVLPAPIMEGGEAYQVQQGAGMAVTKSDEQHEYAACEFLKWFTAAENNLRFVCESAYLPVRLDANSVEMVDKIAAEPEINVNPKAHDCLANVLERYNDVTFYAMKSFNNAYASRKVLDYNLADKAVADRAAIDEAVAGGVSRDEAVASYIADDAFEAWYEEFVAALEGAAHNA